MQYLLLIYEDEKRFAKGFDPAEMSEYKAFGQKRGRNKSRSRAAADRDREDCSRQERPNGSDRWTLRGNKGTTRGLLSGGSKQHR